MGQVLEYATPGRRWAVKRVVFWTVFLVVGLGVAGFLWVESGTIRGRLAGRAQAERQWAAGKATIYAYGLRRLGNNIEPTTGLEYEPIAGCMVDDEIMARAEAHNERIRALIASHGVPAYSWLKREVGVLSPLATWKGRVTRGEVPVKVGEVAAAVTSGVGRRVHQVRMAVESELEVDGGSFMPLAGEVMVMDEWEVLGGMAEDGVLYFRVKGAEVPGEVWYGAMADGRWLRWEVERVP